MLPITRAFDRRALKSRFSYALTITLNLGGLAATSTSSSALSLAPDAAPAPGMCWYYTDPSCTQGFWNYCP
jgi:hypothetical protein